MRCVPDQAGFSASPRGVCQSQLHICRLYRLPPNFWSTATATSHNMGIFTPSAPAVLSPVHPPLGIHPAYTSHPQPVTLVLKERVFSFSGDDFGVKDTNGQVVVRCQGKALSFKDRKGMYRLVFSERFHVCSLVCDRADEISLNISDHRPKWPVPLWHPQ